MTAVSADYEKMPLLQPLGDNALLVRFGVSLSDEANRAALAFSRALAMRPIHGVVEVVPNLVSVLLRYEPAAISFLRLSGEIGMLLTSDVEQVETAPKVHTITVKFDGPDLAGVAESLGLTREQFIAAHNQPQLRVLATGFAPGFVYCGFHSETLHLPRRRQVRPKVPAGSILFAARQTAIAATDIPTGWHVIGQTRFRNFDPADHPPTQMCAGDLVQFEVEP